MHLLISFSFVTSRNLNFRSNAFIIEDWHYGSIRPHIIPEATNILGGGEREGWEGVVNCRTWWISVIICSKWWHIEGGIRAIRLICPTAIAAPNGRVHLVISIELRDPIAFSIFSPWTYLMVEFCYLFHYLTKRIIC